MVQVVLPQVTTEIVSIDTNINEITQSTKPAPFIVITGDRGPHNKVVPVNSKKQFYKYFGKPNISITGPGHYIVDNVLETMTDKVHVVRASVVDSKKNDDNAKIANAIICSSSQDGQIAPVSAKFNFVNGNKFVYIDHEALVGMNLDTIMLGHSDVYSPIAIVTDTTLLPTQAVLSANYTDASVGSSTSCLYVGVYPYYIRDVENSKNYKITKIQKILVNIMPSRAKRAVEQNFYYQLTIDNVDSSGPWAGKSTINLINRDQARLDELVCQKLMLDQATGKLPSIYAGPTNNTSTIAEGVYVSDGGTANNLYCYVFRSINSLSTGWEAGNIFIKTKTKIAYSFNDVNTDATPTKFLFKQNERYAYILQTKADFNVGSNSQSVMNADIQKFKTKVESLKGKWIYPELKSSDDTIDFYSNALSARQVTDIKVYTINDISDEAKTVFKLLGDWSENTISRTGTNNPYITTSTVIGGLFPNFVKVIATGNKFWKTPDDGVGDSAAGNNEQTYGFGLDGEWQGHATNHLVADYENGNKSNYSLLTDQNIICVVKIKLDRAIDIPTSLNDYIFSIPGTNNGLSTDLADATNIDVDENDSTEPLIYFRAPCFDFEPYTVFSDLNKSKFRDIKKDQTNNVLTFTAIGTGKFYNDVFITAERNIGIEKSFVDINNTTIYPYNFINLSIWQQSVDSTPTRIEGPIVCSLLKTDNVGKPFKHPINGRNMSITSMLSTSYYVKCFYGAGHENLRNADARAKLISYLLKPEVLSNISNTFNDTYGGVLLAGGEDGCIFDVTKNNIDLKHPEVTKTLISIYNGTCFDESGTIDKLDEYINPVYRLNYIVTGGFDYTVNIAAMNLTDKRKDCLCISDVGTTNYDDFNISGAYQDKTFVSSLYSGIDSPHAAIYTQSRNHNDVEFTNHNIVLPSTYYALWHNMNIDNRYFVSEPVAGNPKTGDSDAPVYIVKTEQQQYLLNARCNPTIRENGRVSYYLDELTMQKKYDGLSYIHCIKFIHLIKVELADMLRPYIKRKMVSKYASEIQSVVTGYLSQYNSDTLSEKLYSLTSYDAGINIDEANSIINVNLNLSVVKGINAIAVTLNVK